MNYSHIYLMIFVIFMSPRNIQIEENYEESCPAASWGRNVNVTANRHPGHDDNNKRGVANQTGVKIKREEKKKMVEPKKKAWIPSGNVQETRQTPIWKKRTVRKEEYTGCLISHKNLPKSFDAREKWKECASIGEVGDQSKCGSCWAVAVAATFTDRICINSRGAINPRMSAHNLMTCCRHCSANPSNPCTGKGGYFMKAWEYLANEGICTGGYSPQEGCQPYKLPKCNHAVKELDRVRPTCAELPEINPLCQKSCYNKFHNVTYTNDIYKVSNYYKVQPCEVMEEIYRRGPVTASFKPLEDYHQYKTGVYRCGRGKMGSSHAVRIIGWGVEGSQPYWLAVNSFNEFWGDNGMIKILRGKNECGIESEFYAGTPQTIYNKRRKQHRNDWVP